MTDPVALADALAPDVASRAARHDSEASFPTDDLEQIRAAGLLGLMTPEHLGGMGADFVTLSKVLRALAHGSGATALVFTMHAAVTGALAAIGDDLAHALGLPEDFGARRDELLRAAAGGAFYQVAMSERGAGSRFSQMTTSYEPDGPGWLIRGRKTFCTGAGNADAYLVVARSPEGRTSYFIVPAGAGITVERTWDSLGMRSTRSDDVVLDAHVAADALVGAEDLVQLAAAAMPQWLVSCYAAVYVGLAEHALDTAAQHVVERGLTQLPSVRSRIGRADAAVAAAWATVQRAATEITCQPGSASANRWVYRAKLIAGDTASEVTSSLMEACGTSSTRRGHPLERLFRDARCGALHPATSDVCADWLGASAVGLDPEHDGVTPRW